MLVDMRERGGGGRRRSGQTHKSERFVRIREANGSLTHSCRPGGGGGCSGSYQAGRRMLRSRLRVEAAAMHK
jgi:hypothetical protein